MGGKVSFPRIRIPKERIFVITGANTGEKWVCVTLGAPDINRKSWHGKKHTCHFVGFCRVVPSLKTALSKIRLRIAAPSLTMRSLYKHKTYSGTNTKRRVTVTDSFNEFTVVIIIITGLMANYATSKCSDQPEHPCGWFYCFIFIILGQAIE